MNEAVIGVTISKRANEMKMTSWNMKLKMFNKLLMEVLFLSCYQNTALLMVANIIQLK